VEQSAFALMMLKTAIVTPAALVFPPFVDSRFVVQEVWAGKLSSRLLMEILEIVALSVTKTLMEPSLDVKVKNVVLAMKERRSNLDNWVLVLTFAQEYHVMTGNRAQQTHVTQTPEIAVMTQFRVAALNQAQRILVVALLALPVNLVVLMQASLFAVALLTAKGSKPTVLKQQIMSPKELDYA
jgi:hypothetical protein